MIHEAARPPEYVSSVAVEPFECLRASWSLIVGGGRYGSAIAMSALLCIAMMVPYGSIVLMGPAYCGIYYVMFKWIREEEAGAKDMFKGFEWMWESFAVTLLRILISSFVMIPLMVVLVGFGFMVVAPTVQTTGQPPLGLLAVVVVGGYLILIFVGFVVRACLMFIYTLIVDRGLQPMDALKWSFVGGRKHLPGLLALYLLNTVIVTVLMFFCLFPAFLFMPIAIGSIAFAHVKIFGLEDEPSYRTFETEEGSGQAARLVQNSDWKSLEAIEADATPAPVSAVPEPASELAPLAEVPAELTAPVPEATEEPPTDARPEEASEDPASVQADSEAADSEAADQPPSAAPAVPLGSEETVPPAEPGDRSIAAMREAVDQEIRRAVYPLGGAPTEAPTPAYKPDAEAVEKEIEHAVNPTLEPPASSRRLDVAETRVMDGYPKILRDEANLAPGDEEKVDDEESSS